MFIIAQDISHIKMNIWKIWNYSFGFNLHDIVIFY